VRADSTGQMLTQAWWAPASVERRRCGWGHSGRRSAARPGAAAVRRSMAGWLEERSRVPKGWLCAAVGLEVVALDKQSLSQMLDESPVTLSLSQDLAEAG
jgi:hypothetical protein